MNNEPNLMQIQYPQFIHDFAVQVYERHQDPFKAANIDLPEEYQHSLKVQKFKAAVTFLCLLYQKVMQSAKEDK